MSHPHASVNPAAPWRQTALITAGAVAVYLLVRWLPLAEGGLHYTDFGAGDRGFLEFCEPGSPQFVPVDRVHSPVTLTLRSDTPLRAGTPARITAKLATTSGKPIMVDDLLVVHTRKLHLLLIDSSLEDYQHVHPEAAGDAGEFEFTFTPQRGGDYRVFADFMPRATGRALYAGANLHATSDGDVASPRAGGEERLTANVDGLVFRVSPDQSPLRINQTARLVLTIAREQGGAPELEEVMGAPAHLVAFDENRSGFAHLHPAAPSPELAERTDAGRRLAFSIHLPSPGRYRLWAQVQVEGREVFAPFDLSVSP